VADEDNPLQGGRLDYNQLLDLAQKAGFQGQSANMIAHIAQWESGGNPLAINPKDPQGSYGVLQINQAAHPGTVNEAMNPQEAFNEAFDISKGGTDFRPWSTYRTNVLGENLKGTGFAAGMNGNNVFNFKGQPFQSGNQFVASEYPSFQPIKSEGASPTDLPNLAINLPMNPQQAPEKMNPIFLLGMLRAMTAGTHTFAPVNYDPWAVVKGTV